MKNKYIQIRIDENLLQDVQKYVKDNDYDSVSSLIRKLLVKEVYNYQSARLLLRKGSYELFEYPQFIGTVTPAYQILKTDCDFQTTIDTFHNRDIAERTFNNLIKD